MPRLISDVLRDLRSQLSEKTHITIEDWRAMLSLSVTSDRRSAKNLWDICVRLRILKPINGKSFAIDHDLIYKVLSDAKYVPEMENGPEEIKEASS